MARLHEIVKEIDQIMLLVDEDGVLLPEAEVRFDELMVDKEIKFENIAHLIENYDSDALQFKAAEAKMKLKKKMCENASERLNAYLKFCMERTQQTKYEAGMYKFRIQEFQSIDVPDPTKLPKAFQKITIEAKKNEIKEAMKLGKKVKGASVKVSKSLIIS